MLRKEDRFTDYAGLGEKLRQIRLWAGLSLEELVRRMDRSEGYISRISRLERGRFKQPSISLMLDFLRACGASVAHLLPVFDPYTSRPVPLDVKGREQVKAATRMMPVKLAQQLQRYDSKTAVARRFAGEAPFEPDEREMRIRRQARTWLERGMVDDALRPEMDNLGVLTPGWVRKFVFDYGHKVFAVLKRTRPREGARPDWRSKSRETLLAEAETKALSQKVIPIEGLKLIQRRATAAFDRMEEYGVIGVLPTVEQARQIGKPFSSLFARYATVGGISPEQLQLSLPYDPRVFGRIEEDAVARMSEAGIPKNDIDRYRHWLSQLQRIALETEPDSEEHRQRTEAELDRARDRKQAAQVAEMYYAEFERWRPRLFKKGPAPKGSQVKGQMSKGKRQNDGGAGNAPRQHGC